MGGGGAEFPELSSTCCVLLMDVSPPFLMSCVHLAMLSCWSNSDAYAFVIGWRLPVQVSCALLCDGRLFQCGLQPIRAECLAW